MHTIAIPNNSKLSKAEFQHKQLVLQTRKWVSQAFYGTMLKQMHDSPFKSKLFSGGRGGEAFGGMLDQQLADHMSNAGGDGETVGPDGRPAKRAVTSKLVQSIVRKIESAQAQRRGNYKVPKRPAPVVPHQLNVSA